MFVPLRRFVEGGFYFESKMAERAHIQSDDSPIENVKGSFLEIVKDTFKTWWKADTFQLGAALAYYSVFSIGPLLLLVVAMVGMVFGEEAAQGHLHEHISQAAGPQIAQSVETLVAASRKPMTNALATIVAVVVLLVGASGFIRHLKRSLNIVWGIAPSEAFGWRARLKREGSLLLTVVGLGAVMLVLLTIQGLISAIGDDIVRFLPFGPSTLRSLSFLFSFGVLTGLFALIFRFLPDARIRSKDVILGAAFTAVLFVIGKYLLGLYLTKTTVASVYGAAGSIIVILLAAFYFSQIIFLGAEFTQLYAKRRCGFKAPHPQDDYRRLQKKEFV